MCKKVAPIEDQKWIFRGSYGRGLGLNCGAEGSPHLAFTALESLRYNLSRSKLHVCDLIYTWFILRSADLWNRPLQLFFDLLSSCRFLYRCVALVIPHIFGMGVALIRAFLLTVAFGHTFEKSCNASVHKSAYFL